uniref:non-specific serine/threonine protein kinase n=1 Tax=Eriocheir sinensis TaxID=95602 RepID=A0A0G3BFX6_ERISI|nr:pelle [Eriocheir sinensis]
MSRAHEQQQEVKYVYDLPYTERKQLCNILDSNNDWERLGGSHMNLKWGELEEFRRAEKCGESPTNRLLQAWGQQNHTVMELFLLLWQMKHFQAMRALQSCIPEKYHRLINDPESRVTEVFMEKKPVKGVVIQEPPQPAAATGQHIVQASRDSSARPHNTPSTSTVTQVSSQRTEEKSSLSLSQQTTEQLHLNYSVEGACALDPSHYHNLQKLDQKLSNPNYCSSSKVPVSLLCPASDRHPPTTCASITHQSTTHESPSLPVTHTASLPKSEFPSIASSKKAIGFVSTASNPNKTLSLTATASNPKKAQQAILMSHSSSPTHAADLSKLQISSETISKKAPTASNPNKTLSLKPTPSNPVKALSIAPTASKKILRFPSDDGAERKINNNEGLRTFAEVSCEDNNQEDLKSKAINAPYDPDQDYLKKVEEKYAREVAHKGNERRTSERSTSASSNSITVGQVADAPPPSPNQLQQQLQEQQQQQPSSSRKISNVSDAESPYSSVPVIPYKELEEATALFSQHNLLGRGGFGAVYKGTWKNTEVAIKRIEPHGHAHLDNTRLHITQSLDELKLLQSYRHDNILQVYGYSTDHELYPCLVYQFMPHGSLEDRLQCRRIEAFGEGSIQRGPEVLGWRQRFRVALGTAGALQFLHTVKEKPLIHGDVKSANILLDQNYEPKLGDFGLAREGKSRSTSIKVSRVHGTKPYLPGDYLRSKKLSVKVDTYSFGIVLFELCTGLRAYDDKRKEGQKFLWELVEESNQDALRDRKAHGSQEQEVFPFLFKLGKDCVQQRPSMRPDMTNVFKDLESYKIVMEERARARRISMGESSSGCSTPHLLQVQYDTAGSLHSPSTVPSFPYHYHHPSSSPSAVSTLPPSPSPGLPRSPVPPGAAHYYQHSPLMRPSFPGMVINGQVTYLPRAFPPRSQPVWVPGPSDMVCGMPPAHPSNVPKYYIPHNMSPVQHDPPSYSETMSQAPTGAAALPNIPQLSGLNINSNSESVYSDESDSKSSVAGITTHSIIPTVLPQYLTPPAAAAASVNEPLLPLLTELNNASTTSS